MNTQKWERKVSKFRSHAVNLLKKMNSSAVSHTAHKYNLKFLFLVFIGQDFHNSKTTVLQVNGSISSLKELKKKIFLGPREAPTQEQIISNKAAFSLCKKSIQVSAVCDK